MARDGWFDGRGLDLINSTREALQEKWNTFLEDGIISSSECIRLRREIYDKLAELEPHLDDDTHRRLTPILVLYEMLVELQMRRADRRHEGAD